MEGPYKGLEAYGEADREYFFGRERDRELIAANLYAAPLTVFYGASGVGKSSVLLAEAAPKMRETPRVAVVVFREWQDAGFREALAAATLAEVSRATGRTVTVEAGLPLDGLVMACESASRCRLFFVFDQFEEYFRYQGEGFDAELARAVNSEGVRANFLLALREDELSRLDRLKGRIPQLLGNLLRIRHLDRAGAERAIRRPVAVWRERGGAGPAEVEEGLVTRLLDEVRVPGLDEYEAPLLQLVLTRLWAEGALELRALERLGGTAQVVRGQVEEQLAALPRGQQAVAAKVLRFLVTPAGAKMAQEPRSLAEWAGVPVETAGGVLEALSQKSRILRRVTAPGGAVRYELFHDLLGPGVRDWGQRYLAGERWRRRLWQVGGVSAVVVAGLTFYAQQQAKENRALVVANRTLIESKKMLEKRLEERKAANVTAAGEVAGLRRRNQQLTLSVEGLAREVGEGRVRVQVLEREGRALEKEKAGWEERRRVAAAAVERLPKENQAVRAQLAGLRQEKATLEAELNRKSQANAALHGQLAGRGLQVEERAGGAMASMSLPPREPKEPAGATASEVEKVAGAVDDLQARIRRLEAENQRLQRTGEELTADNQALEDWAKELRGEVERLRAAAEKAEQENAARRQEIAALRPVVEAAEAQVGSLQAEGRQLAAQRESLYRQNDGLRSSIRSVELDSRRVEEMLRRARRP